MNWLVALAGIPRSKTMDRHRPGYFRDYYKRNAERLRPYIAAKKRQYRREKCSQGSSASS